MSYSKCLCYKGHIKKMSDTKKDKKDMVSKNLETNIQRSFSVFFKNEFHKFVVLKTERLASAVYLVSGFVSESDPLRVRLRTCALDLVGCVTDSERSVQEPHEVVFGARCLEMGSLFAMAERANLISPMNAKVLSEEYASVGSFVKQHAEKIFSGAYLVDFAAYLPKEPTAQSNTDAIKREVRPSGIKRTQNDKRHENRRDKILSLLNIKDKITVKDVSSAMENVSEKTAQRELISMVDEGVLLKEGERRWSTYRKAS